MNKVDYCECNKDGQTDVDNYSDDISVGSPSLQFCHMQKTIPKFWRKFKS